MPFTVNIHERPALFHRFDVLWTPTVLVMDAKGVERARIEGFLPRDEFRTRLELALARVAFTAKRWGEAEQRYADVAMHYPNSVYVPEAVYWRDVSRYKGTNDHLVLGKVSQELSERYPDSEWTQRAQVWAPAESSEGRQAA